MRHNYLAAMGTYDPGAPFEGYDKRCMYCGEKAAGAHVDELPDDMCLECEVEDAKREAERGK